MNNIKFSIISINDRAADNKKNIRDILSKYDEVSASYVDGNNSNTLDILNNLNITLDGWDYRSKPMPGELGVWLSNINLFKKIIEDEIDNLIIFEDDAVINNDFCNELNMIISDLPKDYDFISLVFPSSSKYMYKEDANINNNVSLAKYNHFGLYSIMWSNKGAKTILESLNKTGITSPIDIYLFNYLAKNNIVKGYSVSPERKQIVFHGYDKYGSTIDIDGKRGMLDV